MPYAKKSYRRYSKRRSYARRRPSNWAAAKTLAMSAYRGVKYLRGLVNSELYKYDNTLALNFSTTGSVTHLTPIAQGDGDGNRTGNSILVKSVQVRLLCQRLAANTTPANLCTLMLVQDNQQISDTAPAITDILETSDPRAFLNSNTVGRFKILRRMNFVLDTVGRNSKEVEMRYSFYQHHVRYNGTAGTDQQKGALYLICVGDQVASVPAGDGVWRVTYHDN